VADKGWQREFEDSMPLSLYPLKIKHDGYRLIVQRVESESGKRL
jgi:hypothetical protein